MGSAGGATWGHKPLAPSVSQPPPPPPPPLADTYSTLPPSAHTSPGAAAGAAGRRTTLRRTRGGKRLAGVPPSPPSSSHSLSPPSPPAAAAPVFNPLLSSQVFSAALSVRCGVVRCVGGGRRQRRLMAAGRPSRFPCVLQLQRSPPPPPTLPAAPPQHAARARDPGVQWSDRHAAGGHCSASPTSPTGAQRCARAVRNCCEGRRAAAAPRASCNGAS